MDIEALAWLGRYYANRILAATHLQFYLKTYYHPELSAAYEFMQMAVEDWGRLAEVTEEHFGYFPDRMRCGEKHNWREEGRDLDLSQAELDRLEREFRELYPVLTADDFTTGWFRTRTAIDARPDHPLRAFGYRGYVGHVPPLKVNPGQPYHVQATAVAGLPNERINLFYRKTGDAAYKQVPLKLEERFERTWGAEIPASDVVPGRLEYYFELRTPEGMSSGGTLDHRPAYVVAVTADDLKPVITPGPPERPSRAKQVTVMAKVEDRAGIQTARVCYKRMPSFYEWACLEMAHTDGNNFSAHVPITPEGILYYFEAVDKAENAVRYPDFLKQTPYIVIEGWDSGKGYEGEEHRKP